MLLPLHFTDADAGAIEESAVLTGLLNTAAGRGGRLAALSWSLSFGEVTEDARQAPKPHSHEHGEWENS